MRIVFFLIFIIFFACGTLEKKPLVKKNSISENTDDKNVSIEKNSIFENGDDKNISIKKNVLDSLLANLPDMAFPFTEKFVKPLVKSKEGFYYPSDILVEKKLNNHRRLFNRNKSEHNKDNENYIYNFSILANYPCYKYRSEQFVTIGSLVAYSGENDTPGVYFIVFNFNEKGEQLDYLIVYHKIANGGNNEYNIKIDEQLNIDLDILWEDYFDYENGGYIEDGEEPFRERKKESYKTSKEGFFTLVKK